MRGRRPLCMVAASLALGLWVGQYWDAPYALLLSASILGSGVLLAFNRRALPGILLCFFLLGALQIRTEQRIDYTPKEESVELHGVILDIDRIDEERTLAYLVLGQVKDEEGNAIAQGRKIRVRVNYAQRNLPEVGAAFSGVCTLYTPPPRRNPGGFDSEGYYRSRGIVLLGAAETAWEVEALRGFSLSAVLYASRQRLGRLMDTLFGYAAPLYRGMLLGDKQGLDAQVYASIKRSGIAHLLAVSGLHVSVIVGAVYALARRLQISLRARVWGTMALLWAYCLLTGAGASTLRASVMNSVFLLGALCHERYDTPTGLAAAFLLLALPNAWCLRDTGFVLSFATVGGILLIQPLLRRCFARLPTGIADTLSISLGAQLACMPFLAMYFGEISLVGMVVNLLAVPLASVLVVSGAALLVLAAIALPLAMLLAPLLRVGAYVLQGMAQFAAQMPFSTIRVAAPHVGFVVLYYGIWYTVSGYVHAARKVRALCIGALCACAVVVFYISDTPPQTRYVQLDVGQGDAALLQTAQGTVILVDVGPTGNSEMTSYLLHYGLSVDVLVLSHLDSDHAGGIVALERAVIPVGEIVLPYGEDAAAVEDEILQALHAYEQRGVPIKGAWAGDVWTGPGVEIEVLAPKRAQRNRNDGSLVTMLRAEGVRILSTGDASQSSEPLHGVACDVIKVAHHGAQTSSSELFLDRAMPTLALISVGRNAYGHPRAEVLERLWMRGVQVMRTDEGGAITLTLAGGEINVQRYKEQE